MSQGSVLITGASSGIGRELAKLFAADGNPLVLVARNRRKLEELAREVRDDHGLDARVLPMDLSRPRAAQTLFRTLKKDRVSVDVLVNNAGTMENGEFAEVALDDHVRLLELNVVTPTTLLRLFVPPMLERRKGRILNVASMAAFQAIPRLAAYAASKAYLLHLSEALSEELRDTGVTVTALCPGFTGTEILSRAPDLSNIPSAFIGSATEVARDAYRACLNGQALCVSGTVNQLAAQWVRFQPRWLTRAVAGTLARRNR